MSPPARRGRWIALEGGEGSGKSTQATLLASSLGAVLTREPGGTPVGSEIRALLLGAVDGGLDPKAEALLMAADRAQHVASVVAPALAAGRDVVSDRSAWSSLAYQGYGRGLDVEWLRSVSDWAMGRCWPDVTVLIDVPLSVSRRRVAQTGRELDRLEAEGGGFHERVLEGFRVMAAGGGPWVVVDGGGAPEVVAAQVARAVAERLGE